MSKILYISNIAGKKFGLSFVGSAMYAGQELGFEFHAVANRSASTEEQTRLDEDKYGIKLHHIDLARTPYSPKNIKAYKQLCELIKKEKFNYIHCNTPTGGILGRLAGKKCGVKEVLYQVHGFHFYKGAPKLNWLLYYPIEKLLARWTDALITINKKDYEQAKKLRLRKNGKVFYVPGVGINIEEFKNIEVNRDELRASLGLTSCDTVLISAGRLDTNKNNETIIRALAKVPNVKLLLCGDGEQKEYLTSLANELGMSDRVLFLGMRTDIKDLYKISDVFVMMSYREGLSRSIMEAMASGLPCVVSKIRGNVDLIDDGVGGYLCSPKDADNFAEKIAKLAENKDLRKKQGAFNVDKIKDFDVGIVTEKIKEIYSEVLKDKHGFQE